MQQHGVYGKNENKLRTRFYVSKNASLEHTLGFKNGCLKMRQQSTIPSWILDDPSMSQTKRNAFTHSKYMQPLKTNLDHTERMHACTHLYHVYIHSPTQRRAINFHWCLVYAHFFPFRSFFCSLKRIVLSPSYAFAFASHVLYTRQISAHPSSSPFAAALCHDRTRRKSINGNYVRENKSKRSNVCTRDGET